RALLLGDIDLIRQLVHIARGARKVLLQMLAGGVDRLHDAIGELAVLEADGQLGGSLVPEAGRHFIVDAAIAEDGEAVIFGGDEEQDSVSKSSLGHAQAFEGAFRESSDVGSAFRLYVDANLARGLRLRVLNRLDDAILIELFQKFFLRHLPASARAAAPK